MAALPLSTAHLTAPQGSWTSGLFSQGKVCRYEGTLAEAGGTCPDNGGVSGTYIGPAGVVVAGDIFPLRVNPGILNLCPEGYCATPTILCDLEVGGSGTEPSPHDEHVVDAYQTNNAPSPPGPGLVPDGTWDDGGFGGACHSNHYDFEPYNTLGCNGSSRAHDLLSDYHVWILAACDYQTAVGANNCRINEMTLGLGILDPVQRQECIDQFTCPVLDPAGCSVGALQSCEADGTADAVNLGQGAGHRYGDDKKWPAGKGSNKKELQADLRGVPYPADRCTPGMPPGPLPPPTGPDRPTAATFVLTAVKVKLGSYLANAINSVPDDPVGPGGEPELIKPVEGNDKPHGTLAPAKGFAALLYALADIVEKRGQPGAATELRNLAAEIQRIADGGPGIKYSLASAGWVDWASENTPGVLYDDKGVKVNLPFDHLPDCSDRQDNDGDTNADANDPGCYKLMGGLLVYDPTDDDESGIPPCTFIGTDPPAHPVVGANVPAGAVVTFTCPVTCPDSIVIVTSAVVQGVKVKTSAFSGSCLVTGSPFTVERVGAGANEGRTPVTGPGAFTCVIEFTGPVRGSGGCYEP